MQLNTSKILYKYHNYEEAVVYLQKSADHGHVKSLSLYAFLLLECEQIRENGFKKFKYLLRAGNFRDKNALFFLGSIKYRTENYNVAIKLFESVYEEGSFHAKIWLTINYLFKLSNDFK